MISSLGVHKWLEAKQQEIESQLSMKTQVLTQVPEGKTAIDYKVVFKVKLKPYGTQQA